jgi:radical SAM protein with 4Fe4S-binding SPASM domain
LLVKPGDRERELTREEMLKIVDELAEMGATWLQLIGGEPLLRAEETLAVTARAQALGIETTIVTNGALIGEDLAREILAGRVPKLAFSVDGVGEVHDHVRGVAGAFERTRRGLALVVEERRRRGVKAPVIEIWSTLSRLNYDQVEPLLRFKAESRADEIVFSYLSEISPDRLEATRLDGEPLCTQRWAPAGESLRFSPKDLAAFRGALGHAPADKQQRLLTALGDEAYLRCRFPTRRCYFMRSVMIINPFGDAYPCPHIDRYVTGSVRESGVKAVWQNERQRKVIAGLGKTMYPVCSSCCLFGQNLTPLQMARLALGMRL